MTRLLYISNARLPSPMAHGLQIMQNCEAFTQAGAEVRLWVPRRRRIDFAPPTDDIHAFYGVDKTFPVKRLPCIDLLAASAPSSPLTRLLFYLQLGSYALVVLIAALFTRADIYYSRDPLLLLALSLIKPRARLVYESHRLNQPGPGAWLQRQVLARCAVTVAITPPLRDRLDERQAGLRRKSALMVAHDGVRRARFAALPTQTDARQAAGWPQDALVVGYVGRLRTLGMDKGVGLIIDALAQLHADDRRAALALVGGPDEIAAQYRDHWRSLGLPDADFLYAGQVPTSDVPRYLAAFDVCVMPFPWTEHYAYFMSPIKLFEYMASGRALVATDLPSIADVLTHEVNALLIPPGDADALAAALGRLLADTDLRDRLSETARQQVMAHYTWDSRARAILAFIRAQTVT